MYCGVDCFSRALEHGSVLRRALPINICAGVMFSPVTGVFLSDSSTRCGSVLVLHFFQSMFHSLCGPLRESIGLQISRAGVRELEFP